MKLQITSYQLLKQKYEKHILILLFVLAITRLFIFSAAFPFFNNVDEQMHFDLVVKYARGYIPDKNYPYYFDRESIKYIARYGSPEYLSPSILPKDYKVTPETEAETTDTFLKIGNHELFSPPLYYVVAGIWYNIGKHIGIHGGYLLYWIRFLNIPIYCFLLLVAYQFCKLINKNDITLRYGVMLLLTFIPQDVFYSINNDVLSALFSTISLYMLFKLYENNNKIWFYGLAGIMIASTVLIKLSNLPIIMTFLIIYLCIIKKNIGDNTLSSNINNLITLPISVLVPLCIWCGFNYYNLGDCLGTNAHIDYCGWKLKSFGQLWDHPIFSLKGGYYFISNLTTSFWRGEFVWHLERIKSENSDILYLVTSFIFSLFGMLCMLSKSNSASINNRLYSYILISIPLCFILFLVFLSIRYDFNNDYYPSRKYPYFVSGRLLLAAFIPYLIVYVKGIEYILSKIKLQIDPLLIILIISIYSFYSEVTLTYNLGVFSDPLNFFHSNLF